MSCATASRSRATATRAATSPAAAATTPAAAATSAAAAVTACCKSQASAKRGLAFFVEDVEGRQADVRDFLLSENNSRCHVWYCSKCDFYFETIVYTKVMDGSPTRDDNLPSRLVA